LLQMEAILSGNFSEKLYGWIRCRYSLLRTVFDRGGVRPVRGTPLYERKRIVRGADTRLLKIILGKQPALTCARFKGEPLPVDFCLLNSLRSKDFLGGGKTRQSSFRVV